MNYLAHLLLTEQSRDGFIGALLGDVVRGRPDPALPAAVRRAIALHRRIDSYTDAHPAHRRSRERFERPLRRYAGIVVDVCYDHFLAAAFERHAPCPLDRYARSVYALLGDGPLPEPLDRIVPRMTERDWLGSYRSLASVERALAGVSRRARRETPLGDALPAIEARYDDLSRDFDHFFPDLAAFAARHRA